MGDLTQWEQALNNSTPLYYGGLINLKNASYGCACDGKWTYDVIADGTNVITSANLAPWSALDVGKPIRLKTGRGTYTDTTITGYTNDSKITLATTISTGTDIGAAWGTDDSAAVLAVLATMKRGQGIAIPDNTFLNLNGTNIAYTALEQEISSYGGGFLNGDLQFPYRRCHLEGVLLAGYSPYKLNFTDNTLLDKQNNPSNYPIASHENVSDYSRIDEVEAWHGGWAIYSNKAVPLLRFLGFKSDYCDNGAYINHTEFHNDSGDLEFSNDWRLTGRDNLGTGIQLVKVGGFTTVGGKVQGWGKGLYGAPDTAAVASLSGYPLNGIYCTGTRFEDNNGYDVQLTSETGVAAASYPSGIIIAGGTIHHLVIDKCQGATISAVNNVYASGWSVSNNAKNIKFVAIQPPIGGAFTLAGTGTSPTNYTSI